MTLGDRVNVRIIPARAGFTGCRRIGGRTSTDHPRSRGVYDGPVWRIQGGDGSSPLARGLQYRNARQRLRYRIIPARAGFTATQRPSRLCGPDHPRSRGVYSALATWSCQAGGSSPLARGLLTLLALWLASEGIIPARAGFTTPPSRGSVFCRDHPRSRGVYFRLRRVRRFRAGSSPLARGLQPLPNADGDWVGIIPARAGFTMARLSSGARTGDHPRSRGVYCLPFTARRHALGSSPLARGLPPASVSWRPACRIIPARAGFTLADPWNPNDEPHYQTAFTFTADLAPAPQSSDSAVVSQRSTRPPSEA